MYVNRNKLSCGEDYERGDEFKGKLEKEEMDRMKAKGVLVSSKEKCFEKGGHAATIVGVKPAKPTSKKKASSKKVTKKVAKKASKKVTKKAS